MSIVKITSFIYEDGNVYYFKVNKHSTYYYKLKVYVRKHIKFLFIKYDYYKLIGSDLIDSELRTRDVKSNIDDALQKYKKLKTGLNEDWDGFIGNVSEEVKKSFMRENKLNNILEK